MNLDDALPDAPSFRFVRRPVQIPGDLRIAWRVALVVLILNHSRSSKASLAKLHLISDALRSERRAARLDRLLHSSTNATDWQIRVEPALGRALDFAIGDKLISVLANSRYSLSSKGIALAKEIRSDDTVFSFEKKFLERNGPRITENIVDRIVRFRPEE